MPFSASSLYWRSRWGSPPQSGAESQTIAVNAASTRIVGKEGRRGTRTRASTCVALVRPPRVRRVVADRGDLLLVPVDEEDALADPLRVAAVGLVERLRDHGGNVTGDGKSRYLFPSTTIRI